MSLDAAIRFSALAGYRAAQRELTRQVVERLPLLCTSALKRR
jgi:hypothetical protein